MQESFLNFWLCSPDNVVSQTQIASFATLEV